MKKLTGTSLVLTLALSCGATSVMASSFEDKDMAFAFESEGTMEVATLSEQEMKETEGAFVGRLIQWGINFFSKPVVTETAKNAGYGAAGGSLQYGIANGGKSDWSAQGQFGAAISGAAGGAVGGVFKNPGVSVGAGAGASGLVDRFNSSTPSTNNSSNFGRDVSSYCGNCYTGNGTYGWPRR